MEPNTQTPPNSKKMTIAGWIVGGLPATMMILSSPMAILKLPASIEGMAQVGYPEAAIVPIGIAELISAVLYMIPKTSVLGAILLTGYFGGAVATHVRVQDGLFFIPIIFGVIIWGGLWLRSASLRALLPIRRG